MNSSFAICPILLALLPLKLIPEMLNMRHRLPQTTIPTSTTHLHVYKSIIYSILVFLIPPQNFPKMLLQISIVEHIA